MQPLISLAPLALTVWPFWATTTIDTETDEVPVRTWKAELGKLAPDFELKDLDGKNWQLSKLKGKTVVLEWFNPECPAVLAAHAESGSLATLGNRMQAEDDVVWLAINSGAPGNQGHELEKNIAGRKSLGIEYPVLRDESGYVGRMYGAKTTPHMFVVDEEGLLAYAGGHDDRAGARYVEDALGQVRAGGKVAAPETRSYGCNVKYAGKAGLGLAAPDFELKDLEGKTMRLSDLRGRVVVLEWFNPTCPFVVAAHGEDGSLRDAAARASEQGVAWFAVNSAPAGHSTTGAELNGRAAQQWQMAYPILLDESGTVGKLFDARTTPHMFVLDQRGVLVYAGAHDDKEGKSYVDQALAEVLAGKEVSEPTTGSYGCGVKYGK